MNRREYTSIGGDQRSFQTTHWTAIEQVRSARSPNAQVLIGELLKAYWKPVYCYLRHRGFDNEQAKDLTQEFFQQIVLGRDLVRLADRTKGRFRTFLLRALDHFLVSASRKQTARKRMPPEKLVPLEDERIRELPAEIGPSNGEDAFNYAWISELLDRMIVDVRTECLRDGMAVHWDLFQERVLRPIIDDRAPASLADLCAVHGIEEPARASNMIFAVKRRLQSALKRCLRQSVANDADVDEEINALSQFLARRRQYRK